MQLHHFMFRGEVKGSNARPSDSGTELISVTSQGGSRSGASGNPFTRMSSERARGRSWRKTLSHTACAASCTSWSAPKSTLTGKSVCEALSTPSWESCASVCENLCSILSDSQGP
eukprot:UN1178